MSTQQRYLIARRIDETKPWDRTDFSNLTYFTSNCGWNPDAARAFTGFTLLGACREACENRDGFDKNVVLAERTTTPGAERIELTDSTLIDPAQPCVLVSGAAAFYCGRPECFYDDISRAIRWPSPTALALDAELHRNWPYPDSITIRNVRRVETPASIQITPIRVLV